MYSASSTRSSNETPANDAGVITTASTTAATTDDIRSDCARRVRFCNPMARFRGGGPWYRSEPLNPVNMSRPVETVEQQPQAPPLSPEVLIYEPYPSIQNPSAVQAGGDAAVNNNIRDSSQADAATAFNAVNGEVIVDAHVQAQAQAQAQPQSQAQAQAEAQAQAQAQLQARHGSRCPYARRLSASGYHSLPSYYHTNLQNGAPYLRPAYAPHESLWYRQQNNQEIHRRHMMNNMGSGTNTSTDNTTTAPSLNAYPNRGPTSNDQQHPIGHSHRRMARQYICGLNMVCIECSSIDGLKH